MTSAAFTIFWMKIKLENHSLLFCSCGAVAGMIFGILFLLKSLVRYTLLKGFEVVDDLLSMEQKKLGFVSIFFSFAFALFLLNR